LVLHKSPISPLPTAQVASHTPPQRKHSHTHENEEEEEEEEEEEQRDEAAEEIESSEGREESDVFQKDVSQVCVNISLFPREGESNFSLQGLMFLKNIVFILQIDSTN
jgi:hypothetical protein